MSMTDTDAETIARILRTARTVAVVGASDDHQKAAFYVPAYLRGHGYRIFPIHPEKERLVNRPAYPSLAAVPEPIDVVLIYRRAEAVPPVVEEAISVGAGALWLPIGVVNEDAAARARSAGLDVVMDRCMMVEHKHLDV
jgi:hypothetical protein